MSSGYAYVLLHYSTRYGDIDYRPIGVWTEKWLFKSWFNQPQPGGFRRNPEDYRLFRYRGAREPVEMNLHDVVSSN